MRPARKPPARGPIQKTPALAQWLAARAGPKARAGFKAAPVMLTAHGRASSYGCDSITF